MGSNGAGEIVALLFVIAIVAGFVYLIIRINRYFKGKLAKTFKAIGDKHGLELDPENIVYHRKRRGPVLTGNIAERHPFTCHTYSTGGGKNKTEWTEFQFQHQLNVQGYTLRLVNENLFRKMGKGMGIVKEIELGVQDFDKRFVIDSENLSTTRAIFNRNVRETIISVPNMYFGELLITSQEICYKVALPLYYDETSKHFEKTLDATLLILEELKRVYR